MEITPRELRDSDIADAFRGYQKEVVDEMLERAASALEAANERVRQLTEQVNAAQAEAGRSRETEDILHRTLLLAQRAADEAVAEAQEKARQMVEEAEQASRKALADAEEEARRRGDAERRRLEQEVVDLAARRDSLLADVDALARFEAEYRDRMVRALEADLAALRTRPQAAPGPRPEPSDVDVPSSDAFARREPSAADSTAALDVRAVFEQQASAPPVSAPEAPVAPPAPPPPVFEEPVRADATAEPPPPPAVDTPGPPPRAIDLDDAELEADVLDDDAFFATLREAVHDDAPLGPRDDDRLSFFDHEEDRGSFRDVFRRRR